jgi:hypothetical protein
MPRRALSACELAEAQLVFGDGLDYTRAFVWENSPWPNWIADAGAALHRYKRNWNNAVTVGDTSYFPVTLRTTTEMLASGDLSDISWLMHELTHQWQFQRLGWNYLWRALQVQVGSGLQGYNYQAHHPSKDEALRASRAEGKTLMHFNMEQQGDLARDYYITLKQGQDHSAWEPYIDELRSKLVRKPFGR